MWCERKRNNTFIIINGINIYYKFLYMVFIPKTTGSPLIDFKHYSIDQLKIYQPKK
jgi:hypothetical protein